MSIFGSCGTASMAVNKDLIREWLRILKCNLSLLFFFLLIFRLPLRSNYHAVPPIVTCTVVAVVFLLFSVPCTMTSVVGTRNDVVSKHTALPRSGIRSYPLYLFKQKWRHVLKKS